MCWMVVYYIAQHLFTLTIKWTGKNAIEVIKDYIRSCEPMEYIGLKLN